MGFKIYQAIAVLSSLASTMAILELIRRRRIQDVLWVPWLVVAIAPAIVGVVIAPWAAVAHWLGILYEPLFLVIVALFMSFALLLYLSVVVSSLIRKNLSLAQELALLRHDFVRLEASPGAALDNP